MDKEKIQSSTSYSINPLLRRIQICRDHSSRDLRQMNSNNSKRYFEFRRRSKTTSPTRKSTMTPPSSSRRMIKRSPPLRRLAASLHLPHYRKSAHITKKQENFESCEDWTNRSSSLPSRFAYRSPSVVELFSQQNILEYWPSFDGFATKNNTNDAAKCFIVDGRGNKENLLKQRESFLDFNRAFEIRRQDRVSTTNNEPNFVEVASDRVSLSDQMSTSTSTSNIVADNQRKNTIIRLDSTPSSSASIGVHDKMKQVLGRRLSAISAKVITPADRNNGMYTGVESNNSLSSSIMRLRNGLINENQKDSERVCLKEGRVTLISGFHNRERYLFLFNDLLLVVKENGVDSYTRKDKIKLCELWICADKYYDTITDLVKNVRNCFSIGWPTKNYVAEFGSVEEKNSWFHLLETRINLEISNRHHFHTSRTAVASIQYKHRKTTITRKIAIKHDQTVEELLNVALVKFNLNLDDKSTSQFELWAIYGKDSSQTRLLGYERPLAILKSHIRDLMDIDDSSDVDLNVFDESSDFGLTFFLKQKRHLKSSTKSKRAAAGHLVTQLKKRVMNAKHESHVESTNSLNATGKLFGHQLGSICDDESKPPKVIMDVMENIFKNGIFMEGIFRKNPNHRTLRECREKVDAGECVNFSDVHPSVCASLLKEFLRCLPDSLLTSQLLPEWTAVVVDEDVSLESKRNTTKNLIARLPDCNRQVLRHILCICYHVKSHEKENHMNSHNLSICIGPNLINGAFGLSSSHVDSELHTRHASEIMKFLIENVVELFDESVLRLFGDLPDPPTTMARHDSSEESDSMGVIFRPATSSLDSLIVDNSSPDGSRPHSIMRNSNPTSMNVSHDSGLSDLHASIEDFDDDIALLDRNVVAPCRSLSQSDGNAVADGISSISNQMMAKSVENLQSIKSKLTTSASTSLKASTLDNRSHKRLTDLMTQSWHFGSKNVENMSESSDSLYESLESTCSFEPPPVPPVRKTKRSSSASGDVESTSLVRSVSGDHLISIVVNSSPVADVDGQKNKTAFTYATVPSTTAAIDSSSNPVSFMDRYCAVRKPARHRKGQAPSPPLFKKQSPSEIGSESDEMSLKDQLIIRCQSNDTSSDGDCSRPASTSVSNSIVSSTTGDSQDQQDQDKNYSIVDDDSRTNWLPSKVMNSLSEISRQVTSAHHKCAIFTPRFNEIINDSSTLTDTSSEERTPHVSREGSRARDYKQIADSLFNKPVVVERSEILANLRSLTINDDYRRPTAMTRNGNVLTKRMSHSAFDEELLESRKRFDLQRRRPPSYHETVQSKHPSTVNQTDIGPLHQSTATVLRASSLLSSPIQSKNETVPSSLVEQRTTEPLRRSVYDEYKYSPKSSTNTVIRNSLGSMKPPLHDSKKLFRTKDISWSVKEKVNLFDGTGRCSSYNEHNIKLNPNRISVCDRLNLDVNRSASMSTTKRDNDLMTASCYGPSSIKKENDLMTSSCYGTSALVRLSDSHANYPVVRPPPLTSRLSTYGGIPLTLRSSRDQQSSSVSYRTTTSYRPNRSRSVHQTLVDRRPMRSDTESYV